MIVRERCLDNISTRDMLDNICDLKIEIDNLKADIEILKSR